MLCSAIRINIAITGQESDNLIGQMSRAFVGPKACFWNWRASSTPMAPPSKSSSSPPDLPDVARVNDLDDLGGGGERVKTNADWVPVRICISRHHRSRVPADADALLQVPTQFRLDSASVRHGQPQNIPSLLIQLSLKLPHHEWCEELTAGDIVPLDAFIATRMR